MKVQVDSRKIKPGDTFVALRGVASDGHDYIQKAISLGATKLIVEEGEYDVDYEVVSDTRAYLSNYLKETYAKELSEMKIVGITGTNGKTTSAYLLHSALNNLGIKTTYIGTIGFYCKDKIKPLVNTTPDLLDLYDLFLESYEMGAKYIIMEVSSQGISYGRVNDILFDIAAFTNLTQDHLDYHVTMENYSLEKQKLFKQVKKDGFAIVNYDDEYRDLYLLDNNNITYGFSGGTLKIIDYKMTNLGTEFVYEYENELHSIKTPLLGKYNVYNILIVLSVLHTLKIDFNMIKEAILNTLAPAGRMDKINYNTNSIIIDYAHTPDAVEKIIDTVKEVSTAKIYTVFGCTGDRDRTKRPIMFDIISNKSDHVIITNDDPHDEDELLIVKDILEGTSKTNYEVCLDRKVAIKKGIELLKENDCLLILGKGHEEYIIIKDKKIPFNDKAVVLSLLDEIKINN